MLFLKSPSKANPSPFFGIICKCCPGTLTNINNLPSGAGRSSKCQSVADECSISFSTIFCISNSSTVKDSCNAFVTDSGGGGAVGGSISPVVSSTHIGSIPSATILV